LKNILILPTILSPERLLAEYLYNLDDDSKLWQTIDSNFTKQYCFQEYKLPDINGDRVMAKKWFNSHYKRWGQNATKVINPWILDNKEAVDKFVGEFTVLYNKFANAFSIEKI
jgi:hypothetical protein